MDNHKYKKILKSDWLSTALISALIVECNRTLRVIPISTRHHARLNGFCFLFSLLAKKSWNFLCFDFKKSLIYHKFCLSHTCD